MDLVQIQMKHIQAPHQFGLMFQLQTTHRGIILEGFFLTEEMVET